jgi:DAK2 domain fusion protein YloV
LISGRMLRDAFISAANNIQTQRQQVDALNVFPVPDGDTGTNMSMTIGNAVRELQKLPDSVSVTEVSDVAAGALLRGARGNSGVILSLLFRGFSKGLKGRESAGTGDFAAALERGVEAAYKAVMKPTEGTILTVARLASEKAKELSLSGCGMNDFWNGVLQAARAALEKTPELLPVLKKAGVVDAGGRGFVVILEGMNSVFQGGGIVQGVESAPSRQAEPVLTEFDTTGGFDGQITFTYCTEFIVNKRNNRDPLKLRAFLESIGDCVVVVDDDEIIKVHVHTEDPGKALQEGLQFGSLTNMKIENMREQFESRREEQTQASKAQDSNEQFPYAPVNPDCAVGFVAVAAGEGVRSLFLDLGATQVVSGGQTMNPSTDDILCAIQATPAKTVFVLPNNKNIIMAAEQAARLADREVFVLQTMTVPQGMSAMLAYDPGAGVQENSSGMTQAIERVKTGLITFAARDSDFDGRSIKKGELLAMENGKLVFTDTNLEKAFLRLTRSLAGKDTSFVTVLYGEDIDEQTAAGLEAALRDRLADDIEISFISGGQPVYYFIISVE